MDRGMASAKNFAWLREGGRLFLLGTPRAELKKWERELIDREGWKTVRDGLEVKLCPGPEGTDTFILCRSAARQVKEQAMHERFSKRIVDGLTKLAARLREGRRADRSQVDQQLGRLLQRNSRAAAKFACAVVIDETAPSGLRLEWSEKPEWNDWAKHVEGTYILRSNVTDWSGEELWHAYVQLNEAEGAFRAQKSELDLRPIWHHTKERVEAHILVCFLAYVLWKTLQGWQKRAGLGASPRTILDELQRLPCIDVVLPVVDGPEVRLRCVAQPDQAQADILDRLGVRLPRRLRISDQEVEM
jgi:transposase